VLAPETRNPFSVYLLLIVSVVKGFHHVVFTSFLNPGNLVGCFAGRRGRAAAFAF
jgi:hypothetical protein